MYYHKNDIKAMNRVERLKIINSSSGIKPANLIGTIAENGNTNLAVFSSVIHLGSNPALLGFIARPTGEVPRHTYHNIQQNNYYTINHIHAEFTKNAHYTSAKFDKDISEFERCSLTEEFIKEFKAPFVKESQFKMGMRYREAIPIPLNGTILVIGEIEHLILPDNAMNDNDINLENTNGVGISGLNSYYSLKKIARYPYVRVNEVPEFKK